MIIHKISAGRLHISLEKIRIGFFSVKYNNFVTSLININIIDKDQHGGLQRIGSNYYSRCEEMARNPHFFEVKMQFANHLIIFISTKLNAPSLMKLDKNNNSKLSM